MDYRGILIWYGCLLFSLVIHEASHALFAKWGGDLTAYQGGQVSLNPIPHMKRAPFGTIVLPLAMLFMTNGQGTAGFAHIPVDPVWANRHPKRAALMSAAGPLSNLLIATIVFLIAKVLISQGALEVVSEQWPRVLPPPDDRTPFNKVVWDSLSILLILNLLLAFLNLIPIPPLDGGGIIQGLFPNSVGRLIRELQRQPILMIGAMLLILYNIMTIMEPIWRTVSSWL